MIKVSSLKSFLIFLPIISYTPFFFTELVNPSIRIGYFALVSLYLFCSTRYFTKKDILLLGLITMFVTLLLMNNSGGTASLFSAGNYCLTIFFGWALYRYLLASNLRKNALLDLYVNFFYLVVAFSVLSLLYYITLGELDLFGFKSSTAAHLVTPFGVLFKRVVSSDISVYRSFFYFIEAAHLGIFYAANIIIVAPLLKNKESIFIKLNFIGGFLSMSMTFYAVLLILYGFKKTKSIYSFIGVVIGIFFLLVGFQAIDLLSYSSSDDRTERFLIFFLVMDQASALQLLFGHGVAFETGFIKAFNSGLTLSIYETGIFGAALQIGILFILCPSPIVILFFILAALVVDPIHMPLFWFLIVVISSSLKRQIANHEGYQ